MIKVMDYNAEDSEVTEIQNIICQIAEAEKVEKETAEKEMAVARKEELLQTLYEAVKNAEELFIAYSKLGYPQIDDNGSAWVFSSEEYAEHARDYYMQQMIPLTMKRVETAGVMAMFADLYTWGIESVRLDNGQCTIAIERGKILPPPDWSNTPKEQIPVMNPVLEKKMITFFQNLNSGLNYAGKKEEIHKMEAEMLTEVLKGNYLVPMQLQKAQGTEAPENMIPAGSRMNFANLSDNHDNSNWLPAFTNWDEFRKLYDKKLWNGMVMTYDDLCAVSAERGIVVNPAGMNFRISGGNKQAIEQFKKELAQEEQNQAEKQREEEEQSATEEQRPAEEQSATEEQRPAEERRPMEEQQMQKQDRPVQRQEELTPENIRAVPMMQYPAQLVEQMKGYMRQNREIRRGYLIQAVMGNEPCYLVVVDFLGDREQILGTLSQIAANSAAGMRVLVHETDSLALELVKNTKPFYKRGLFG